MGTQPIERTWHVTVVQPHTVVMRRKGGLFADKLELTVDGLPALSESVGGTKLKGSRVIQIDGQPVEVRWRWGIVGGDPESIILAHNGKVLAAYPYSQSASPATPAEEQEAALASTLSQVSADQLEQFGDRAKLARRLRSGASWFYWIAGLSLVNSLIWWFGGGLSFLAGLAITQIVDGFLFGFSDSLGGSARIVAAVVALTSNILVAGVFALCGYFANKGQMWGFVVGMVLYSLDAIILLIFGEIPSLLFHLFALAGLFLGALALGKLRRTMKQAHQGS